MKNVSRLLLCSLFVLITCCSVNARQPNIIFLFADDLSFNAVASAGHPIVQTPHLDRLAAQGVSFTNAYNQGAWHGAVCVASRSMLNTGRFLWNARNLLEPDNSSAKRHRNSPSVNPAQERMVQSDPATIASQFWARLLQQGGYSTALCGKWHVTQDENEVFDQVRHVRGGMPPTVPSSYNRPRGEQDDYDDVWNPFDPKYEGHWSGGVHWAEVLANDSIETLTEQLQSEKPFFGYFAFNSPHDPRQSPKEFLDLYPRERMDVPLNFLPQHPLMNEIGCPKSLRDEMLCPYPRTEWAVQVHRREYYGIISHMDAQIGRILDAIDKSGERANTFIIFSADNGLAIGSHGLFGKQSVYEHSMKVPLILAGPALPAGKVISTPVYLQDIMPTSLEWAGLPIPDHVQFKSLIPLIQDEASPHYDAIYGAYVAQQRMIRQDDFKLILFPDAKEVLLFDLKNDPNEKNNLADQGAYRSRIESMFRLLCDLQQETGDTLKLTLDAALGN
ncbi:MAG: sulfatase-like hydrolase/transferase [Thermoguttaceae bacterium]